MDVLERAPNDPARAEINPLLKLALELGPLGVFFFTNAYGDRMAQAIPALQALGGRLFIATAFFVVATLISLAVSFALTRRLPVMPLITGIMDEADDAAEAYNELQLSFERFEKGYKEVMAKLKE